MAYIAFQHAIAEKKPLRRLLLTLGNQNEIIHCEFILANNSLRLSAWQNSGVEFREVKDTNLKQFIAYDLGNGVDAQLLEYFNQKKGSEYDTMALITDMIAGFNLKRNNRYFCSEICYDILKNQLSYPLPEKIPSSVSPQQLYEMIVATDLQQVYL
ncbi:hypothetical protein [Emticicia sp. BO119]|uniref:hypothetical protein n=1 Tax=Emticicia sp. BO119 TaxID=2757768 RepID=UPI0015F029EE|nr:hypothetical protein [Emticicia sp. BO119]MBA4849024.1 hypothetical protein [Emticicia sp. BO119]